MDFIQEVYASEQLISNFQINQYNVDLFFPKYFNDILYYIYFYFYYLLHIVNV